MLAVALLAFAALEQSGRSGGGPGRPGDEPRRPCRASQHLGVDRPLPARFAAFVVRFVHGDLGTSWRLRRPGQPIFWPERLPATLELVLVASVLALSIGIPLGVRCAVAEADGWIGGAGGLAPRCQRAHLHRRHPAHPALRGAARLAAGRSGAAGSFGWASWTTGLLTVEGWRAILLPATTLALYQLALDRAARAGRDARGARERAYPLRPGPGAHRQGDPPGSCAPQRAPARRDDHRAADRLADRLLRRHGNRLSMAGPGPFADPGRRCWPTCRC